MIFCSLMAVRRSAQAVRRKMLNSMDGTRRSKWLRGERWVKVAKAVQRPFVVRLSAHRNKKGEPLPVRPFLAKRVSEASGQTSGFFLLLFFQKFFFEQRVRADRIFILFDDGRCGASFAAQFTEQMLEGMIEFYSSAIHSLIYRISLVGNRNGLVSFGASFHLALDVVRARLVAVLVADVDFHAGQVFIVMFERAFNGGTNPLLQSDTAFDVIIAIDLDLHS
ncbi:hypothetical protein JOE33_001793 [Pseudomonas sp. PvP027]|nr:hypothetical protein [Pseudomonas sp. PvP027]